MNKELCKWIQSTKYVACSGTRDGTDTVLDAPRTGDAESAS